MRCLSLLIHLPLAFIAAFHCCSPWFCWHCHTGGRNPFGYSEVLPGAKSLCSMLLSALLCSLLAALYSSSSVRSASLCSLLSALLCSLPSAPHASSRQSQYCNAKCFKTNIPQGREHFLRVRRPRPVMGTAGLHAPARWPGLGAVLPRPRPRCGRPAGMMQPCLICLHTIALVCAVGCVMVELRGRAPFGAATVGGHCGH